MQVSRYSGLIPAIQVHGGDGVDEPGHVANHARRQVEVFVKYASAANVGHDDEAREIVIGTVTVAVQFIRLDSSRVGSPTGLRANRLCLAIE